MNQITTALTHEQILALDPVRREAAELARGKTVEAPKAAQEAVEPAPVLPQPEPAPQPVAAAPAVPVVAFVNVTDKTSVVKLKHPVTVNGELVEQLELRQLTGADIRAVITGETGGQSFASILTGFPDAVLEQLNAGDYLEISEAVQGFLPPKVLEVLAQASTIGTPSPQQ